jgi:hypothetical protein
VDLYHHISIIETLSHHKWVRLLANYIVISPNMKPVSQRILGISIPGAKMFPVRLILVYLKGKLTRFSASIFWNKQIVQCP